MKIAKIIVRSLLGLLFLFASVTYFIEFFPKPELTGNMKTFNEGLEASLYLIPLAKAIELLCGLAFVSGRFVTLATVLIAPIVVNIVCIHVFMEPSGLPVALFVLASTLFLAYYHRENYRPLFVMK